MEHGYFTTLHRLKPEAETDSVEKELLKILEREFRNVVHWGCTLSSLTVNVETILERQKVPYTPYVELLNFEGEQFVIHLEYSYNFNQTLADIEGTLVRRIDNC